MFYVILMVMEVYVCKQYFKHLYYFSINTDILGYASLMFLANIISTVIIIAI